MQDEIENAEVSTDDTKYIEAMKELKKNSVSKDKYSKLEEENKRLLDIVVNGGELTTVKPEDKKNVEELRKELFNGKELNNLEYCKKALELRDAILEDGGTDPFLPQGHEYRIQQSDVDTANKVADIMRECIDYANGDSQVFTNELMRRTKDSPNMPRR